MFYHRNLTEQQKKRFGKRNIVLLCYSLLYFIVWSLNLNMTEISTWSNALNNSKSYRSNFCTFDLNQNMKFDTVEKKMLT